MLLFWEGCALPVILPLGNFTVIGLKWRGWHVQVLYSIPANICNRNTAG